MRRTRHCDCVRAGQRCWPATLSCPLHSGMCLAVDRIEEAASCRVGMAQDGALRRVVRGAAQDLSASLCILWACRHRRRTLHRLGQPLCSWPRRQRQSIAARLPAAASCKGRKQWWPCVCEPGHAGSETAGVSVMELSLYRPACVTGSQAVPLLPLCSAAERRRPCWFLVHSRNRSMMSGILQSLSALLLLLNGARLPTCGPQPPVAAAACCVSAGRMP